MRIFPYKKALFLSPHTDDIEFGCGATINRLKSEGLEIFSAVFSFCEESIPDDLPKDILKKEMYEAAKVLQINESNIYTFNYPVRRFPEFRQEILENMVQLKKDIQPDLVFTPSSFDIHQDHEVISKESIRAFRFRTLLGYELPWNNLKFKNQFVVKLKSQNLEKKVAAINCYKSQRFRKYGNAELFKDGAVVRGIQNKIDLAEIFEVIKMFI